jgi:hypothetical protein
MSLGYVKRQESELSEPALLKRLALRDRSPCSDTPLCVRSVAHATIRVQLSHLLPVVRSDAPLMHGRKHQSVGTLLDQFLSLHEAAPIVNG